MMISSCTVIATLILAARTPPSCRCLSADPCFSRVPFQALNRTLNGRLIVVEDELSACITGDIKSKSCNADLQQTDDEFFYTNKVGGYMHTGLAASWNIAHALASFAVAAESYADVAAGVAFAAKHNLRVAVKGTGHDWFGRSGSHPDFEGSLLIWTHKLKGADWHDSAANAASRSFVPDGCSSNGSTADASSFQAVTLQAGNQFADFYPVAEKRGVFVNGGTCTSVGVGGCTLGGCFGSFSQKFGPSANNVLQAKVVLANGTLVTTNKCTNQDLFWALRGGGAGYGVVVEWTMKTYKSPEYLTAASYGGEIKSDDPDHIQAVAVEVLRAVNAAQSHRGGYNGEINVPYKGSGHFGFALSTYEGNATQAAALFRGLDAWVKAADPAMRVSGAISSSTTKKPANGSWLKCGAPEEQCGLPWDDPHHDTEIGTEHLVSMSKWITRTALEEGPGDVGLNKVAAGLLNVSAMAHAGLLAGLPGHVGIGMHKAQGGATEEVLADFNETSQNPVLREAVGAIMSQWRVPSLPQLPASSTVLKTLWPRLQKYAITSKSDSLYALCAAGAAGNETAAVECLGRWEARIPSIAAELTAMKSELLARFPVTHGYSGSYWNEADYYEPNWQTSFWGEANYPKLLAVKQLYDPDGLFVCHHCVGSELWSEDGNCRL